MASRKGRHRRPGTTSRAVAATTATVSAGAAAGAVIVAATTSSPAAAAPPVAHHVPVSSPASSAVVLRALSTERAQHPLAPAVYTVRSGDYLSKIASVNCGNAADWTGIYDANRQVIGPDYNLIYAGQQLRLDCTTGTVTTLAAASTDGDGDHDGDSRDVSDPSPVRAGNAVAHTAAAPVASYSGGGYGNVDPANYSGEVGCIITHESSGDSQVMNSSGHYGLFQFDYGTWVSGGGNPGDFGHATVGEQFSVFYRVYAARGAEPWAPSDGCWG